MSLVGSSPTASARNENEYLLSRGPAATTSGLHPENEGSSPSGMTRGNGEGRMGNGECLNAGSVHSPLPIPHSPLSSYGSVGNWQTTLVQNQGCCGFESHSGY
jgi:hypothetical protein